jgi:hypothetical protein
MTIQASGWDFFDRIYCISIEERADRRRAAMEQFAHVGLADRIEFFLVRRHPTDVEQGMYESHMACLRKGLEAGASRIVVFEDDVLFAGFDEGRFRQCTRFLSSHPNWKILLLGALIRASLKTADPCLRKVRYQSLAHAYAVNRPFAETLAYTPWQGVVIDTVFRPLTDHIYAVCPMFAFQNDLPSDNKYPGLERFRRCCGGLKRIQRMNEFFHHHKLVIIAAHGLILMLLLWLIFF